MSIQEHWRGYKYPIKDRTGCSSVNLNACKTLAHTCLMRVEDRKLLIQWGRCIVSGVQYWEWRGSLIKKWFYDSLCMKREILVSSRKVDVNWTFGNWSVYKVIADWLGWIEWRMKKWSAELVCWKIWMKQWIERSGSDLGIWERSDWQKKILVGCRR